MIACRMASKEREERLEAATEAVKSKQLSLRVAEEQYQVPKSTIHDQVKGKSVRVGAGRPPVLTYEEEKSIVRSCEILAQSGFGVDRTIVGRVVRESGL